MNHPIPKGQGTPPNLSAVCLKDSGDFGVPQILPQRAAENFPRWHKGDPADIQTREIEKDVRPRHAKGCLSVRSFPVVGDIRSPQMKNQPVFTKVCIDNETHISVACESPLVPLSR